MADVVPLRCPPSAPHSAVLRRSVRWLLSYHHQLPPAGELRAMQCTVQCTARTCRQASQGLSLVRTLPGGSVIGRTATVMH